jgi:iron complex outermembrane receptor protein
MGFGVQSAMAQTLAAAEPDLKLLYENEEVVEIATGTAKPIHLAPSVASVITAKDIKAMGWRTLDEALESVPGLHVAPSHLNRLNSVYSIRGIHTGNNPQVLLSINGVSVKNIVNSSRLNSFRLPVTNISRIEVIRGPGSAVHGSDAFAGVINVITKDAAEIGDGEIGARAGSFDSQDAWAQGAAKINDWDVTFSIERDGSDGDKNRTIAKDAANKAGALQMRYNILDTRLGISNENWNISLWSWNQRDGGVGAGIAQAIDPAGTQHVDNVLLDVSYDFPQQVSGWSLSAKLNHQKMKDEPTGITLYPAGTVLAIGDDGNIGTTANANCPLVAGVKRCLVTFTDGVFGNPAGVARSTAIEFAAIKKNIQDHLLRVGLGVSRQTVHPSSTKNFGPGVSDNVGDTAPIITSINGTLIDVTGTPYNYMDDKGRSSWNISLQDEWQFAPDWGFTGGVRYDHYSDFGGTVNPRAAIVWATDYNLTSKLLLGSAFRAPSFGEEYFKNNPVVLGNDKLKPETINTLELAFDYRPTFDLQDLFNIYYYDAKDLIDYTAVSNGLQAQNLRTQMGYGVEAESRWQATSQLQLNVNFAWQHSEDKNTGATVPYAPGRELTVTAIWKLQRGTSLSANANWVSDRARDQGDTRNPVGDYTLVDVALRHEWSDALEVAVSIRNLFDIDAREPSSFNSVTKNPPIAEDYPLEGRAIYAELRYFFGKGK